MQQDTHLLTENQLPPPPPSTPTTVGHEDYPFPPGLTPREIDVLRLAIAGLDNKHVSQRLQTPLRNVEKYILRIQMKIDMYDRNSPLSTMLNRRS